MSGRLLLWGSVSLYVIALSNLTYERTLFVVVNEWLSFDLLFYNLQFMLVFFWCPKLCENYWKTFANYWRIFCWIFYLLDGIRMSLFASAHPSQETASLFINEKIASARLKVCANMNEVIFEEVISIIINYSLFFFFLDYRLVERIQQCGKDTRKMWSPKENSGIDGSFRWGIVRRIFRKCFGIQSRSSSRCPKMRCRICRRNFVCFN